MPLNAGDLRQRITIQSPGTTGDAFGQTDSPAASTWTLSFGPLWASVKPLTSKGVYALGSGFTAQVSHKISIRWPAAASVGIPVTSSMRVQYDTRTFKIQAVIDPDEQKRQLDLICLENV